MILVTGAAGHAGRAVACGLASLGHDMVAMVRTSMSGTAPKQASLNYHSPLVMQHALSLLIIRARGDALHIAAIRRCLRYATL
jgi:nucleoside-diphosphate-sugar epimerase